jgi:MFS family permease
VLSFFGTFFEAGKNAAVPNITGDRDLLAGNSLMWSSRFLLMSLGAALGGWTAAHFGYRAAFIINSISFLVSAWSVWLIPEDVVHTAARESDAGDNQPDKTRRQASGVRGQSAEASDAGHRSYWSDIREGWAYIVAHPPVSAILLINIIWATGGGAINLICDRLGGVVFAGHHGLDGDSAVAAFYFTNGLGLLIGMLIARRVGSQMELWGRTVAFIGWMLILQGVVLALMGLMPSLILACVMLLVSRTALGVEFAVQDTLLMRLVPDNLRGRVITTDRASELLLWSFSTTIAGWSLSFIVPRTLTIISGLLSGTAGVVWLLLFAFQRVRLPKRFGAVATESVP